MAVYRVLIKPSAVKELEKIPREDRRHVVARIRQLGHHPRPAVCEKLSGQDRYRIRQGAYRVIYGVDDQARTVIVVKVGHRRDVYR
ncbi:MAG: type II toxin-antitoxin system RelE/ParE family toxin [Acidobacteria bacterium]|nr:type II toxin-antitoxin system RelE/ParE family toxin [Acidobacteriota bacterium]